MLRTPGDHQIHVCCPVGQRNEYQLLTAKCLRPTGQNRHALSSFDEGDHARPDGCCRSNSWGKPCLSAEGNHLIEYCRRIFSVIQDEWLFGEFAYEDAAFLCPTMALE